MSGSFTLKRFLPLALGMGCAALAFSQSDLKPTGQYPQFRTLSGLPGAGFGVRPDGTPAFDGAMSFSSPIGYGLDHWHIAAGLANTSDDAFFRWIHTGGRGGTNNSLGKAFLMTGIPLGRYGSLTASYMIISSILDHAVNFQYMAPFHPKGLGLSLGVQDIQGTRGAGAEGLAGATASSRSFYGAATLPLPHGIYASAGWGDRRFEKGFANVSVPIGQRFKFVLEHDGFNFNYGLAFNAKALGGWRVLNRMGTSTMMVGFVRGKYAFWSVNVSF